MARNRTPQPTALRMARQSPAPVISSTAIHWGDMVLRTISMPWGLGQPVSTSIRLPRLIPCGNSSPRSSTTATVSFWAMFRATSRSSVVFPQPGAPRIRREPLRITIPEEIPGKSRQTRMHRDSGCRIPVGVPSRQVTSPHRPMRCPPGAVR